MAAHDLPGKAQYRIIILGEYGVGKTSFVLRLKLGEFVDDERKSEFVNNGVFHTTHIGDERVKVLIEEPAGMERLRSIVPKFFQHTDGILLMYSVEGAYTFENLFACVDEANTHLNSSEPVLWGLLGNKSDTELEIDDIEDRVKRLKEMIQDRRSQFGEDLAFDCVVSAKTGTNVVKAVNKLVKKIHMKRGGASSARESSNIHLSDRNQTRKSCCF